MIRLSILFATMLALVIAHPRFADPAPSANITVTVVPVAPVAGSVACDIGPSYTGSIPAAAAQAGFTHCAANYDFTQTQAFTDQLGTHTWSDLSSWFVCSNVTAAPYLWKFIGTTGCNDGTHQYITTDGDSGFRDGLHVHR